MVTGSAGFIGFAVARRLLETGHKVVGVDNMNDYYDVILKKKRNDILLKFKKYHFHKVHLEDIKKIREVFDTHKNIDVIIHLGAQAGVRYSMENPWQYAHSNYIGSLNIFECAKEKKIPHIISASSSSVYGNSKPPYHEKDSKTDTPISVYAATKKGVESLAHTYTHLYPMTIVNLRFFTVYGPWSRPDMAMLKFAQKIVTDEKIVLYNKGKMKRGFTYVEDIVDGVLAAEHVESG
ncbi:MAG: RfbB protein, partial [Candidatus Parcubacteria bacterium]